jgi:hypothetical protein
VTAHGAQNRTIVAVGVSLVVTASECSRTSTIVSSPPASS